MKKVSSGIRWKQLREAQILGEIGSTYTGFHGEGASGRDEILCPNGDEVLKIQKIENYQISGIWELLILS